MNQREFLVMCIFFPYCDNVIYLIIFPYYLSILFTFLFSHTYNVPKLFSHIISQIASTLSCPFSFLCRSLQALPLLQLNNADAIVVLLLMLLAIKCATCFFAFVIWQLYVWIHWIHWILRGLCSHQLIPSRDFGPKTMWTLKILFHVNVCCHIYEPMCVQRNVWCRMNKVPPRLTNFYNMWKVLTKMCRAETNPNQYIHNVLILWPIFNGWLWYVMIHFERTKIWVGPSITQAISIGWTMNTS